MKTLWKVITLSTLLLVSVEAGVTHFKTINEAVDTFIKAMENKDKATYEKLFTKKYKIIVNERDLDREDVKVFLQKYKESHALVTEDDKEIYIAVGKLGWTFPIPLYKDTDGWYFDINVGIENMKTRAIGRNELAVIEALQAGVELEALRRSPLADIYLFLQPIDDTLEIVALPKDYKKNAIMSFVRTKKGKVLEADLKEKVYRFDEQFKVVHQNYMNSKQ